MGNRLMRVNITGPNVLTLSGIHCILHFFFLCRDETSIPIYIATFKFGTELVCRERPSRRFDDGGGMKSRIRRR